MAFAKKPVSRTDELVVQELNGEVLIYDLRENKAFCLNETSALVWQACDGSKTVAEIGKQLGNEDLVWLALNDLRKENLVDCEAAPLAKFDGMSRRQMIGKVGMGSMLAVPVIASLVAPAAGQTSSICGTPCSTPGPCTVMECNMCVSMVCA